MKKYSQQHAFTLAETIMTLFIVGLVVTAAIPVFTMKQQSVNPAQQAQANNAKTPFDYCDATQAKGLCGVNDANGSQLIIGNILIGNNDTGNIQSYYDTSGTLHNYDVTVYGIDNNDNLFDLFQSDERNFKAGNYYFREPGDSLYITQDGAIPRGGSAQENVIIGKNTINNIAAKNDIQKSVVIGNSNTISNDIQNNTVVGTVNPVNDKKNVVFGSGNSTTDNNDTSLTDTNNILIGKSLSATSANHFWIKNENVTNNKNLNIGDVIYGDKNEPLTFANSINLSGELKVNTITTSSDIRLKNIKGSYNKGLNEILKVNPVTFKYKGSDKIQTGIVAQDIQGIFPEAVVKMPNGYFAVNNDPIFFAMLNAMKEVEEKASLEEQRQVELQNELDSLKKEISALDTCDAGGILGKVKCFFRKIFAPLSRKERAENQHEFMSVRFSGEGTISNAFPMGVRTVSSVHIRSMTWKYPEVQHEKV